MIQLLIDYESVQPRSLGALAGADLWATVFVGAHQHRLPFDFVASMQVLGERGRYVKVATPGKNALDFHLAFYLGALVSQYPNGTYWILSKDSGFDPLIEHLQARGLTVERVAGPLPQMAAEPSPLSTEIEGARS